MNDEELQAIRDRCDAATPGEWKIRIIEPEFENNAAQDDIVSIVAPMWEIADITTYERFVESSWNPAVDIADATFIAHARADIPALLAEVDRLRAALAEIASNGEFVPVWDIGRRMDVDIAKAALGVTP